MTQRFALLMALCILVSVFMPRQTIAQEIDLSRTLIYGELNQRAVEVGYQLRPMHRDEVGVAIKHPLFVGAMVDWQNRSTGAFIGYVRHIYRKNRYSLKLLSKGELDLLFPPDAIFAADAAFSLLNQWRFSKVAINLGAEVGAQAALAAPWQGVGRFGGVFTLTRLFFGHHQVGVLFKAGREGDSLGHALWWRGGVVYGFVL